MDKGHGAGFGYLERPRNHDATARTDRVEPSGQNMVLPGQRWWYIDTHKTDMQLLGQAVS
jgi:hypothetical protein